MAHSIIPVAYVTKWAKTTGIITVPNPELAMAFSDGQHLRFAGGYIPPKHWTTDKAVAEERWRQAVETEAKRLKLAAKKYEALSKGAPVYAKEEG
jgi:hypothetical protein